jgi:hypothetical protein
MNIPHFLPKTMAAACVCLACGCSTMKTTATKIGDASRQSVAKIGDASRDSLAKILPSRIPVVEVREKDLQDMPLGSERALAYEKKKRNGFFSFFTGPVDFEEPDLPDAESEMTGSLLPPKSD